MIAKDWTDYEIIATADGEKLERWGDVYLLRPDPQVIWHGSSDLRKFPKLNAHYVRESTGGGHWDILRKFPESWRIKYRDYTFEVKPMGFKHTGLFPEQAVNWDRMSEIIKACPTRVNVLNLFAYTGGATVACSKAGAFTTHVDASKGMVDRAKINCSLSACPDNVRYIIDDCKKFVEREIKRGKKYDAIIMDPPSYGRGPNGEMWKIEDSLFDLVKLTTALYSDDFLFYLINSYTTGLQSSAIDNILALNTTGGTHGGYEVCLPTDEKIVLPCGCSALWNR